MNTQPFWQKNLALVVGVFLPLLLVLLFWIAMIIPRLSVAPPQYDLILSTQYYAGSGRRLHGTLTLDAEDGRLVANYRQDPGLSRTRADAEPPTYPVPTLYYFASNSGSLREIEYELPEKLEDGATIPITALEYRTLFADEESPDGYRFDSYRGSRGFLFFFDSYRHIARIEKNGRAVRIPSSNRNNHPGSYEFIGWVARENPL